MASETKAQSGETQLTITITLNGAPRSVAPGMTIAGLAAELGLNPTKLAVERNLEIVPRSTLAAVMIADGDRLEIVHFVGGGSLEYQAVRAYNCSATGPMIDLGIVSVVDAHRLIKERMIFAGVVFEDEIESIAKTMFGFNRNEEDFVEINIITKDFITVRQEKITKGFFSKIFGQGDYLVEVSGVAQLDEIIDAYFCSAAESLAILQRYPNKA
ncbi:MAG: sulfur carrier protein ThiS [Pseudomonadota bacterium]